MIYGTRQDMIMALPKGLRCAELGVFAGDFARSIVRLMKPEHCFLVDLFTQDGWQERFFTSGDQNGKNQLTLHMPTVRVMLERELWEYCEIIDSDSVAWLKTMPSDSLDFVYIDTTHSYEQTQAEIRESMRAVRPGGWIAGHDYHERFFPGVVQAVHELGLPIDLTKDGRPSWMIQKPMTV